VLTANFMQPVIQATSNILVVDTGRDRILVDTGFGEKLGPSFGNFPGLQANLHAAGITPESIDLVLTSHGHLDQFGGLVTKSGALALTTRHRSRKLAKGATMKLIAFGDYCLRSAVLGGARIRPAHAAVRSESG
jgi:glyoxylase-like metal-dependent hydrolase (beta-lactamase superfamily II)